MNKAVMNKAGLIYGRTIPNVGRVRPFFGCISIDWDREKWCKISSITSTSTTTTTIHQNLMMQPGYRKSFSTSTSTPESPPMGTTLPRSALSRNATGLPSEEETFKVIKVLYTGKNKTINLKPSEIWKKTSIFPRDLVSLHLTARQDRYKKSRFVQRPPTAILPRTDSILLSFGNVRAVASRDSVMVLDAHQPVAKDFASDLTAVYLQLRELSPVDTFGMESIEPSVLDDPPEMVFLEVVLRNTCDTFARRIRLYEPIVDDFLNKIHEEVFSDTGVHQLVPLKDSLQSFELQVKQALECLTKLLNDDEEMLSLLITEQANARETGIPVDSSRHQQVELLVGVYARQLSTVSQEIQYLLKRIQSKQEFVTLTLAGYRNRMVQMNVTVGIAGVSIGLATAVAGFFGMNLIHGFEESSNVFGVVVASSCMTSALVAGVAVNYLSGKALQERAAKRLVEIETLTGALSDMCALDFTVKRMVEGGERMNRDQFKNHLIKARQGRQRDDTVGDRQVDFLFHVLDTHKDGILSSDDFEPNGKDKKVKRKPTP